MTAAVDTLRNRSYSVHCFLNKGPSSLNDQPIRNYAAKKAEIEKADFDTSHGKERKGFAKRWWVFNEN